jgi:rare lipoprotein A
MLRDTLARLVGLYIWFAVFILCSPGTRAFAGGSERMAPRWNQVTRASWYGNDFAGRRTAAGHSFNPHGLTAAHRTLALGTWVKVTALGSDRAVVVQITDRGPFARNRGIDLSYAAASKLGIVRRGVARVRVETLEKEAPPGPTESSFATLAACKSKPLLPMTLVEWWPTASVYSPEG